MAKKNLVIKHDLSQLSDAEKTQYLRDVSEYIGLDPDLNALDTIWMDNEHGPGRSLVVYARRGTAEILREIHGINIDSLTHAQVGGAIVFTATGKNKEGRQEVATGAKTIANLFGKPLENAIKSASTQSLRRVTMQFTKLGILDESEIEAVQGSTVNPAASAELANGSLVIPPAPTVVNNAPGRDVTPIAAVISEKGNVTLDVKHLAPGEHNVVITEVKDMGEQITKVYAEGAKALAAMPTPGAPTEEPVRPKRARKKANTVSMDVEPETINASRPANEFPTGFPAHEVSAPVAPKTPPALEVAPQPVPAPAMAPVAPPVPVPGTNVPTQGTGSPGQPTDAQMADYRKRVSVYTNELPSSENMGSVQKMRAFITKMSGTPPQTMTTDQWEEMLSWFESFVGKNQVKGLVKYINDSLGVK